MARHDLLTVHRTILTSLVLAAAMAAPARGAVITVTGTGDGVAVDAACTLREAIQAANGDVDVNECTRSGAADPDEIHFAIAGAGPHVIQPLDNLPDITSPAVVDGSTQAGSVCPNSASPGDLRIVINGALVGGVDGLVLATGGSTIRGLVINGFADGYGIRVEGSNNHIECNFIGTDASGSTAEANLDGVGIVPTEGTVTGNVVGASGGAGFRNVISGNTDAGVEISFTDLNVVAGNFIGTSADGAAALGNAIGVNLDFADENVVGTDGDAVGDPGERNVISGNTVAGVQIEGAGNVVAGNFIGTNAAGDCHFTLGCAMGNGIGVVLGLAPFDGQPQLRSPASAGRRGAIAGRQMAADKALVKENLIAGNDTGILVTFGEVDIPFAAGSSDNCVVANGDGVVNDLDLTVVFEDNWWGAADGPSPPGGTGSGDSVVGDVDFDPFLAVPAAVCAVEGAVEITKTPASTPVFAGQTATFTIGLRNSGPVTLTNLAVADPLTPDCVRAVGELPDLSPTMDTSYVCTTGPLFSALTNTATVTADAAGGQPVAASASATVEVVDPVIEITKTPATQQINAELAATFTITMTNLGGVDLVDLAVSDPATVDCERSVGELPDLPAGAPPIVYTCTTGPISLDLVNVATVTATTRDGAPVSASASASVDVVPPLEIVKSPSDQQVVAGGTATFTITVKNPSGIAKTAVAVVDPLTPSCDRSIGDLAAGATSTPYTCSTGPLFASFTNVATATATAPEGMVTASAGAYVNVVDPPIGITKTPSAQLVDPGGTATFTITVSNPGSETLTGVTVTDPATPDCAMALPDIPAGGSSAPYPCSTGPLTIDFVNVATVDATTETSSVAVTASASALVNVRNPIEIIKAPAEQTITAGEAASFTITIVNDGADEKTAVVVADPLSPDCARGAGEVPDLAPAGGSFTYTCTTGPLTAGLVNVATVTAQGVEGPVMASDMAAVEVTPALIAITKTPVDQTIEVGETASFTIVVTNPGPTALTGVTVSDPATPDCDRELGTLAAGASITPYVCTTEPLVDDLTNVATAAALAGLEEVTATATARVEVIKRLAITKLPTEQDVFAGATATFTIQLTNTGPDTLSSVAVADPLTPACSRPAGSFPDLAPGASTSPYNCQTGPLLATLNNLAIATAEGPAGTVTATAGATVHVVSPGLAITKEPAAQMVDPGQVATFTIQVTNPGPGALSGIAVADPLTPDCARAVGSLPDLGPGASTPPYTCQTGSLSLDFTNVATATATPPVGPAVTAAASAFVNVLNPIEIIKAPLLQTVPMGGKASFVITITNDGDSVKTNVAVADPLTPDCARAPGDIPDLQPTGGNFTYTCETEALLADFTNVATVTADSPEGPVAFAASADVVVVAPTECVTGPTATGAGDATLCFTGDGAGCSLFNVAFIPLAGDLLSPPNGSAPPGVVFPFGLFSFGLGEACTPGFTATFSLTLPSPPPAGTQYWKYGPTSAAPTPHWYVLPATIAGNVVTFSITDGGLGDHDLTADGTIVDPGGPGAPQLSIVEIPTLGTGSLLLLGALLALAAVALLRRGVKG
jgi:CSLREA domain-containing protein/uncharacterized repeat protein (TIGR01451 family)